MLSGYHPEPTDAVLEVDEPGAARHAVRSRTSRTFRPGASTV